MGKKKKKPPKQKLVELAKKWVESIILGVVGSLIADQVVAWFRKLSS